MKRDLTSGTIVTMIDTNVFTRDERAAISDELHELLIEVRAREAVAITERGLEVQLEYLRALRSAGELVDFIMDALDSFDKRKAWV